MGGCHRGRSSLGSGIAILNFLNPPSHSPPAICTETGSPLKVEKESKNEVAERLFLSVLGEFLIRPTFDFRDLAGMDTIRPHSLEVYMFRKVITASVLGLLLAGTVVSTPASAATISNGSKCTKVNSTTKVKGYVYKCTKNPAVKNAKITWVSLDCLSTHAIYAKQNTDYLALVKSLPATLADLDAKIAAEQLKAQAASARATALDAQSATWTIKLAEFTAARDKLSADGTTSPKKTQALASYAAAIRSLNAAIRSNAAASISLRKVGNTVTTMQATRAATVTSIAQAKSGVAESLKMRSLICQKGL